MCPDSASSIRCINTFRLKAGEKLNDKFIKVNGSLNLGWRISFFNLYIFLGTSLYPHGKNTHWLTIRQIRSVI